MERRKQVALVALVTAVAATYPARLLAGNCTCPSQFQLKVIGSTTIQIGLAWQPVTSAARYVVERSDSCDFSIPLASYQLSSFVTAYGDTGKQPNDKDRFNAPSALPPPPATYYYRVRAELPSGEQVSNCVSAQLTSGPIRGVSGDLWADVVLGQPDFAQNTARKTTAAATQWAGGMLLDKTRRPNRLYIADTNHNRVLGFDHIGTCSAGQQRCTSELDCGGQACVIDPHLQAAVVLGQPSLVGYGACNNDGTGQHNPARLPATADSLCLIDPLQISIGETVEASMMAVDDAGSLYVPDLYNNRIVKYPDPFTSRTATEVWGQADFTGNGCNRAAQPGGVGNPSGNTLCLGGYKHAGAAIDDQGNLWASDPGNARVLRFPKVGGTISKDADLVLGQPSFTANTRGGAARGLSQFAYPFDIAFDRSTSTLYVADAYSNPSDSRVLEFRAPFTLGMAANRALPMSFQCNDPNYPSNYPSELTLDTRIHGLWVQNNCFVAQLVDLDNCASTCDTIATATVPQLRGSDVDDNGNLFLVSKWYGTYRFRSATNFTIQELVFTGSQLPTSDTFLDGSGITLLGNQLVDADTDRLLIWNDFDGPTLHHNGQPLANGQPADDLFGEPDFTTATFADYYSYPQVYQGQLWVQRRMAGALNVFNGPLSINSSPVQSIPLNQGAGFTGYPVLGLSGQTIAAGTADQIDFAVTSSGNEAWIADRSNNRVFRIANVRSSTGAYVDVVLGQADATSTPCNQGAQAPRADGLCFPYDVALDAEDNLYIADNGGETGSNGRILEFDKLRFAFQPGETTAKFGLAATRVFGTGGAFDTTGIMAPTDPEISPFKPIFLPGGAMIVGNNPYPPEATRHPVVYLDPLVEPLPQLVLGDFTSYPKGSYLADQGRNLYVSDSNWSRVLVYQNPLQKLAPARCGAYREGVMADSPVGYWRLGETSGVTAIDETGGHNGTYLNAPTLGVPGALSSDANTAVNFSQTNDYVEVPDAAALRLTTSFAIEFWAKSNSTTQSQKYFVNKGNSYAVIYEYTNDAVEFFTVAPFGSCNPGYQGTNSAIPLADTNWHHIVYSFDDVSNTWAGYKDGAQVFSVTCDFNVQGNNSPFVIGAAGNNLNNVDAVIDEVALYDTALTPWQVRAHYNRGTCSLCTVTDPGQTTWVRRKISANKINDGVAGNDSLSISGQFRMATGRFSIDPLANGAQIEVRSASGSPKVSISLPPGAYVSSGPGWVKNSDSRYTFRDNSPGGTSGIYKTVVQDKGAGTVEVLIQARKATFGLLPTDAPLAVTIVLGGAMSGAAGECGEVSFAAGACRTNVKGTKITCK